VTFADITDRRHVELDVVQLRQELARVLRVATMGELVASLAHEINQPLTAIMSNAQAAQRLLTSGRPDLGEIREILADVAADDQRAGEVVSRVRSLLKKENTDRKRLEMNDVIREVLGLLRTSAILKGVGLVSELSTDPLPVLGDRIQLQQVLLNLVMNSFDALQSVSAGGRELVVRSQRSDADGVIVSVRDNGSGIALSVLPRVFEPFFTSKPDGMGMGLPICRSIVESHGGRIWAENNPDRGATFQFALPIAEEERDEGRGEGGSSDQ
jgi:two-component system sensor kinase FixL